MLNVILLITAICLTIGVLAYLFFWNRFMAWLLGLMFRLAFWNQAEASVWLDLGSIHFSILTGRIIIKDLRYHSSNQTIRIVKGQISWRYWIRNPAIEEDLSHAQVVGEDPSQKERSPLSCRVHVSLQGLEWFIYNRTASYDNIVSQMQEDFPPAPHPTPSGPSTIGDARDAFRKIFSVSSALPDSTRLRAVTSIASSIYQNSPNWVKQAALWVKSQLPHFDPKNLLPISLEATKAAIICGNASTPSLLVLDFNKAEGTYGIVQARSKFDLYKQVLNIRFRNASVRYVENAEYNERMEDVGLKVYEHIKESRDEPLRPFSYLSFASFGKLWRHFKLWQIAYPGHRFRIKSFFGRSVSVPMPHPTGTWGWRKTNKNMDDETPLGSDFSTYEYAIERNILEAPMVELLYYADVVGTVPFPLEASQPQNDPDSLDPFDIGNGDQPPEWGMDFVIRGGLIRYGPWADRQRVILQHCFFPQLFHDLRPTTRLKPGDTRMWTGLKIFIELRDGVTLHLPFREASKDWQWDGQVNIPSRPRKRESASIHIKAGDSSTISYIMPMVVSPTGYQPILEVHLDTVTVTSSLNDIRLLNSESCRVRCQLPSPIKWNGERQWTFSIKLRKAVMFLLRDHINMLTDLGKDWSSGPPTDYHRFIPMLYAIDLDMQNYEINTYVNDHNIIDKPLIREDNALLTLHGAHLTHGAHIPILKYRPDTTTVSFWVRAREVFIRLTLPRWNTYSLYPIPDRGELGQLDLFGIDGSYSYHADVREENVDHLQLDFDANSVVYKAFGWTIRHFMLLRDNYFGSFTHFSTLHEYLEKRRKGQHIGDPIELQYRPGKSNSMEVVIGLSIDKGIIIVPAGLPGFEIYLPEQTDNHKDDLGACLFLRTHGLQLDMRTNDYYMDMSLNVDSLTGHLSEHSINDSSVDERVAASREVIVIDDLAVVANRLFGLRPRTSTYVCIWEIHVGDVKASLSTHECRLLAAVGSSFGLNFSDPLNAPAKEFVPSVDSDVTFLKVTLDTVTAVWLNDMSAMEIILSHGLRIDSNDLAGKSYRKVTSIRVPLVSVKALLRSNKSKQFWRDAAFLECDIHMDMYSAPINWQESARAQREFIAKQDSITGRARFFYDPELSHGSVDDCTTGRGLLENNLYLPQLRIPRRGYQRSSNRPSFPNSSMNPSYNQHRLFQQPESDADDSLSETHHDANFHSSHPVAATPDETVWQSPHSDEESLFSGDESDNADLTDRPSWDSDNSDATEDIMFDDPWPTPLQQGSITTLYKAVSLRHPAMWETSPFITIKKARHGLRSHRRSNGALNAAEHSQPTFDAKRRQPLNGTVKVIRVQSKEGVTIWLTPLMVPIVENILGDIRNNKLSPELRFDGILANFIQSCSSDQVHSGDKHTSISTHVASLRLALLGFTTDSDDSQPPLKHRYPLDARVHIHLSDWRLEAHSTQGVQKYSQTLVSTSLDSLLATSARCSQHFLASHCVQSCEAGPFQVHLGSSSFKFADGEVAACLGRLTINLNHSAPPSVLGMVHALMQSIGTVTQIQSRTADSGAALDQQIIFEVLKYSRERTVIDPLSTIQPSYLVQKGMPDRMRRNCCFKFLVFLRQCLRQLKASERTVVTGLKANSHERLSHRDLMTMLQSQYQSQDDDFSSLSDQTFLRTLFVDANHDKKNDDDDLSAPDTCSLRLAGIFFTVDHRGIHSDFSIGPMSIIAHSRTAAFVHTSIPNLGKNSANIILREREKSRLRHLCVSISVGELGSHVVPQLLDFIQDAARELKSHNLLNTPEPLSTSSPVSRSLALPPTNMFVDIAFSIEAIHLVSTAAKLVVEFDVSHLNFVSTSLLRFKTGGSERNISMNHSVIFTESTIHLCDSREKGSENYLLASFAIRHGRANVITSQESPTHTITRMTSGVDSIELSIPRSILHLYQLGVEWRVEYLPGIGAIQALLVASPRGASVVSRVATTPTPSSQETPTCSKVHIQLLVSSISARLRVMRETWLLWEIRRTTLLINTRNGARKGDTDYLGLQLGPHIIRIFTASRQERKVTSADGVTLEIPILTLKGSCDGTTLEGIALAEFLQVTIKPADWDMILSVVQKSEKDFRQLLHLVQEGQQNSGSSSPAQASPTNKRLKIVGSFRMKGLRIGAEAHASTIYLECDDISGGVDNKVDLAWRIRVSDLTLSLASGRVVKKDRNHRSAFVTIDFQAYMKSQASEGPQLQVAVTKVHAVMQPTSVEELSDFVDHIQTEVLARQRHRVTELSRHKEKARTVARPIDVKVGEAAYNEISWLDRYTISLSIKNIGVAFPLAGVKTGLQMTKSNSRDVAAVRAFLFSIKLLSFGSQHGESGQATMKGTSVQFISSFNQSNAADFAGDHHDTRNRLLYPEMMAQMRMQRLGDTRRIRVDADVSGFILDLDPGIVNYLFSLVDVYRQGKERMDRFTTGPRTNKSDVNSRSPASSTTTLPEALPASNILLSLTFASGRVRMHSTSASPQPFRSRSFSVIQDALLDRPSDFAAAAEIFDLPVVTVWGEYRTATYPPSENPEPSILIFKATIHSSQNTLKPGLLPFITQIMNQVETRLRQSDRPNVFLSPVGVHEMLPTHTLVEEPVKESIVVSGIKISLSLRIDQSRLELTCQPDVNVNAGLHWDSGGFILNIAPGARRVAFTGTVGGLTVSLKHGFLSEDCVRLDARNLAFNVAVGREDFGDGNGNSSSTISVVVDTEFSGGVRFSRLQDVLCFKAVWLDRIPVFSSSTPAATPGLSVQASQRTDRTSPPSQDLTIGILLRLRSIHLDADLGQSITSITMHLNDMIVRTRLCDSLSEFTLSIARLDVDAIGNITGKISCPNFRFQTIRESGSSSSNTDGRMLDLSMTSGVFSINLESEYQKLVFYRAEPIEVKIYDDWTMSNPEVPQDDRRVDVAFTVSGTEVIVIMHVGTIPKLVSYATKFKATLDSQKDGASRESKAFRIASSPKPDNPLSAVANAMLQSTRNRLKETNGMTYAIGQRMSLKLQTLQLVVFPRSMRDPELAQFVGRDVHARLDRLVESPRLPARRDLELSFWSITTSRLSQLNHALLAKEVVDDSRQWLSILTKDAAEATIFGLPSMVMQMHSEEIVEDTRRVLAYDFSSKFSVKKGTKEAEDIYITLNMSLYSWLTSLRKTFTREMQQVQAADLRAGPIALAQQAIAPRKRGTDGSRSEKDGDERAHSGLESIRPPLIRTATLHADSLNLSSTSTSPSKIVTSPTALSRVTSPPNVSNGTVDAATSSTAQASVSSLDLVYEPRDRHIERLTMRQLGEATPDVMHPFFMKKAGFSLEDSLPQYVHEYATMPTEEIMKALLKLYSKQLSAKQRTDPSI